MKWKIFRSEIDPHEGFNEQLAAAREPYAQAWKEFDRLEGRTQEGGIGRWINIAFAIIPYLAGGAFGFALLKHHKGYVIAAFVVLIPWSIFRELSYRRRFAEWPCPRCHSVWPGTKTEKDSSCRVCGLRLHQMAP